MEAPMYGRGSAVTNEVNLTHSPPRARASAALRAAGLALRMAGVSLGGVGVGEGVLDLVGADASDKAADDAVRVERAGDRVGQRRPHLPHLRVVGRGGVRLLGEGVVREGAAGVLGAHLLVRGLCHAHLRLVVDAVGEFLEYLGDRDLLADEVADALATPCNPPQWGHGLRPPAPRPPRSPPPLSDLI